VASQDGFVSVWDIRHSEKLCKLGSKQVTLVTSLTCWMLGVVMMVSFFIATFLYLALSPLYVNI
jgi:hypothetical protein